MSSTLNAFVVSGFLLCCIKETCSEFCNELPTDNWDGDEPQVCLAGCCGPEGEQYCCMRDDTYHLIVIGLPLVAVFVALASLAYLRWYCKKKILKNKGDVLELYGHVNTIPAHMPFLQSISDVNVNANDISSTESTHQIPYMEYEAPPPSYSSIYPRGSSCRLPGTASSADASFNPNLSPPTATHDQDSTHTSSHSNIPTTSSFCKTPPPSYSLDDPNKKNVGVNERNGQQEAPPRNYSTLRLLASNNVP